MKSDAIKEFYTVNGKLTSVADLSIYERLTKPPIYETVRIINGVPIHLEDHLNRMFKSAKLTNLNLGATEDEIRAGIKEIILKNNIDRENLRLYSGEAEGLGIVFMVVCVESTYPSKEDYENGIKTILYNYERDNPNAKVLFSSFKEDVAKAMKENSAFEALLVRKDGCVSEGSRSNTFFLSGETLYTAPKEEVLLGTIRKYVFQIAESLNIKIVEESINVEDIKKLEGAIMTGTGVDILPISDIGDIKLNSANNNIIKELIKGYNKLVDEYIEKNKDLWR